MTWTPGNRTSRPDRRDRTVEPPDACWQPLPSPDLRLLAALVDGPQALGDLIQRTGMFKQAARRAALWAMRHGLLEAVPSVAEGGTITASTVLRITATGRERVRGQR